MYNQLYPILLPSGVSFMASWDPANIARLDGWNMALLENDGCPVLCKGFMGKVKVIHWN